MADEKLYGRADLVAIAGVPDDAVAFWLRNDLLVSYVSGDRKHRRFPERELKFAMLLGELRNYGMNVRAMSQVVDRLRDALAYYDLHPRPRLFWDTITALHSGEQGRSAEQTQSDVSEHLRRIIGVSEDDVSEALAYSGKLNFCKVELLFLAVVFEDAEILTIEREESGAFNLKVGAPSDYGPSTPSCLVLNLGRIFARSPK